MTWHSATRRARRRASSLPDQGREQAKENPLSRRLKHREGFTRQTHKGVYLLSIIADHARRSKEKTMIAFEIISTTTALIAMIAGSAGAGFFAGLLVKDIAKYGL